MKPGKALGESGRSSARTRTAAKDAVGIGSVEIGLDVLKAFIDLPGEASLTELSRVTGLAPSKLHRYLVSLARSGMVSRSEGSGRYDLGPAARTLGANALTRFDGFDIINGEIKQLSARIMQEVFVYVWTEGGPVLVRSHSSQPTPITLKIGSTLPLLTSGCGPLFLAFLPPDWTRGPLKREAGQGAATDPTTGQLIERVRQGYALDGACWAPRGVIPYTQVCAAPIFDVLGNLTNVIGAAFPSSANTSKAKGDATRAIASSARRVSEAFGYRSDPRFS